ncbi:MAG: winged helix-turn-helix transcriptional regulator [Candidatus Bathyarchaeia archaeon]
MSLDEYDSLILKELLKDNRKSLTALSETTGLSRFAVKNRVRKLFEEGFIYGSTVVLNPFLAGLKRTVFFEFKTNPHEPWLAEMLEKMDSCDILDGITGEYSLFGRFRMFDDAHFSRVLRMVDAAMSKSFFKKYRVVDAIRIYKETGVPFCFKEETESSPSLDEVDLKILDVLLHQAEYVKSSRLLSTVELSRLLRRSGTQISQPTVFKRLKRLEEKGVILGHTLRVNWSRLGFSAKFIVRVKVNPNAYDDVARNFLAPMNEITDLYRTGEDYGLLAFLRVRDVSAYNSFLLKLYQSKDIIDTYTTLVLEERKNMPLPLKAEKK